MNSEVDLNLDSGWRIGEEAFAVIEAACRLIAPRSILEFGSGASTARLARAFPDAAIVSIDHDAHYLEDTRRLLERANVQNVELVHAPIASVAVGPRRFQTYAYTPSGTFDVVIIDGPPAHTRRGREACLYLVFGHVREGGLIFLDDSNRLDEQQTIRNWRSTYADALEIRAHSVGHGVTELRKLSSGHGSQSKAALADNMLVRFSMAAPSFLGRRVESAGRKFLGLFSKSES